MSVLQGSLDRSDFLLDRRATLTDTNFAESFEQRVDEYDLEISGFADRSVKIVLTSLGNDSNVSFDTFLQVIDAQTGAVVADSDDDDQSGNNLNSSVIFSDISRPGLRDGAGADDPLVPNAFIPERNRAYKIRVTSFREVPEGENPYELQVTPQIGGGSVPVIPRLTQRGETQTTSPGSNVTVSGQLDNTDVNAPAPAGNGNTRVDEFFLETTDFNEQVTLDLVSLAPDSYNPYLQIVDANTGQVVAFNDDDAGSLNSQISNFALSAGVDYRVRVTSSGSLGADENPYTLRASVDSQGTVELTPHEVISGNPPELPQLSIDDIRVEEGDEGSRSRELTVSLSEASDSEIAVDYREVAGTATTGEDYTTLEANTLTFAPGETTQTISVEILGDTAIEEDETFNVELENPVNATIADANAVGEVAIVNDDNDESPPNPDESPPNPGDELQYRSYTRGQRGSDQFPDPDAPINEFYIIGLSASGADDVIDFNALPNVGNPPVFRRRQPPSRNDDGGVEDRDATWIIAFGGNDRFTGTNNDDMAINGNAGEDRFDLGNGFDLAVGGRDNDLMNGDGGDDILNGNKDSDTLNGGEGADTLFGGQGNDIINGGEGADELHGQRNQDTLTGGADGDTFVLNNFGNDLPTSPENADLITDFQFSEGDSIRLDGFMSGTVAIETFDLNTPSGAVPSSALVLVGQNRYIGVVQGVTDADLVDAIVFNPS